jgi:hypothetical protein
VTLKAMLYGGFGTFGIGESAFVQQERRRSLRAIKRTLEQHEVARLVCSAAEATGLEPALTPAIGLRRGPSRR